MTTSKATTQNIFTADVLQGLSAKPKYLSSKYFYDDEGSRLFQEIMKLPEYYLTRAETEIFQKQTREIFEAFAADAEPFDLIELGAGDGTKTSLLIDFFLRERADFRYVPVDISREALTSLTTEFTEKYPALLMRPEQGDYFRTLETFKRQSDRKKIILFLGSNVGNFSHAQALDFFRSLRRAMNARDRLLTGFDLHKNPKTILRAYDDAQGVTAKFNLNLLKRINRELGGDFNIEEFSHYAAYHPTERAARSFLISQRRQTVSIEAIGERFEFAQWEPIFMEISQKYDLETIDELARESGFEVERDFFDDNRFYVDSLWRPGAR